VGSRAEPLVRGSGGEPSPETESFLRIGHPKEGANWWSNCHECHLESFLVRYTTEDSFIVGSACGKKWGTQKPESLGV